MSTWFMNLFSELFAISRRLKTPCPPLQHNEEQKFDFTNVADFACNLKTLNLQGCKDNFGSSNIIPNDLTFDFVAFKSLTKLVLIDVDCCPEKIESISHIRWRS